MRKKPLVNRDNDYYHYSPLGRLIVKQANGNIISLSKLILGYVDTKKMRHFLRYPSELKVKQLQSVYLILEGKYSFPIICSLAAGYSWNNIPINWFDEEMPPVPPQLERVSVNKRAFEAMLAEIERKRKPSVLPTLIPKRLEG